MSKNRMLKKSLLIVILLTTALVISFASWRFFTKQADVSGTDRDIQTAVVSNDTIEEIVTAQGTLEPKEYVDLGAQVSGQLKKINVHIGDDVEAGDLVAEIDPQTYIARVRSDEAQINGLKAQISGQEAVVEKSKRDFERNKKMAKSDAVSKGALQDSETAVKAGQAQLDNLRAQLEGAESNLDGDKANLGYTNIYTPIGGTVVVQEPREGQTLNSSQTAPVVARIANLDTLTVRAEVAEADVMRLRHGMPAYFTTLRSSDIKWDGVVRLIQPAPKVVNQVVLFDTLVDVDNKDRQLMTGMSAQVFFVVAKAENVPVIPVSALGKRLSKEDSESGQAYSVQVINGKDKSEKTVHVGLMDRTRAEIVRGLSLGDVVVLNSPLSSGGRQGQPRFMSGPRL